VVARIHLFNEDMILGLHSLLPIELQFSGQEKRDSEQNVVRRSEPAWEDLLRPCPHVYVRIQGYATAYYRNIGFV
jgi:hypothetical protein